MRASVGELHRAGQSADQLRSLWHLHGEDCLVLGGGYFGRDHFDACSAYPASEAEADWASLTPGAPGLKPKDTS